MEKKTRAKEQNKYKELLLMKFFLKQNANHIMKDHTVYMRIPAPIDHHQDIPVKVPDFTGKKNSIQHLCNKTYNGKEIRISSHFSTATLYRSK